MSSSVHIDNKWKNILILGEGPRKGLDNTTLTVETKYPYIPHISNLFLIPDLFVRPMMTCLWCHYWFHEVLWRLNKQKRVFTL